MKSNMGLKAARNGIENEDDLGDQYIVMPNRSLILFLVFLDLFGVGLIMPLVTPLIKSLGATPMQVGLLSSFYGSVQLISSPFMGLLSDRWGRKSVMFLSNVGTMVGYFLLGFSVTLQMVVLSRVITGLLKHSQNAIKAYVADHTTRSNRAVELGRMATASALGIMVGPTVGGFLFKAGGYRLPGILASFLYLLNTSLIVGSLPPDKIGSQNQTSQGVKAWYQHLPRVSMLARPRIAALFIVRFVLGLAVQTFRQGLGLLLLYRFNFDVQGNGLLISYQGALSSLVQGFAIKPLVRLYGDGALLLRGMILLGLSFFGCSWSPTIPIMVVMLTPVAFASGVLRTTFTATITAAVPSSEVGQILGLSDATMSACRVIGPTLAGLLANSGGPGAPGLLSGFLMLGAAVLFYVTGCAPSNINTFSKEGSGRGPDLVLKVEEQPLLSTQEGGLETREISNNLQKHNVLERRDSLSNSMISRNPSGKKQLTGSVIHLEKMMNGKDN